MYKVLLKLTQKCKYILKGFSNHSNQEFDVFLMFPIISLISQNIFLMPQAKKGDS